MADNKPIIIYISPGPVYRPENRSYQEKHIRLSSVYSGYIFTTSSRQEEMNIGSFKYSSMLSNETKLADLKFLIFCIKKARELRKAGIKVRVVDAYDPIKTGLIACVVAKLLKTKMTVQVNGVYTSPAEWVDNANSLSTIVKKNMYPLIMRFVLKRADGIKLLFSSQIDIFSKITKGKIIRNFANYVDTEVFLEKSDVDVQKEVLFVGYPFKRKGVDILIEAFKKIAPKHPDWKLKILGWYPDTAELYKAIDNHPQIYHVKAVHHHEMPMHLNACSILALPSRSEAMGRVLVEAMAAGRPRIGSNVDGIPTVITDGVDGILVNPEDPDDLAEKLVLLITDPDLRSHLGNNARERAIREFNKEIYFANISSFFNEVIHS